MTITPKDREFLESVFGQPKPTPQEPPERKPNIVPGEGRSTTAPPDPDAELREYTSLLFHGYYDG